MDISFPSIESIHALSPIINFCPRFFRDVFHGEIQVPLKKAPSS